ncbi:hypothetical protein [Paenirhodobacter enshiensis]|uniref:hypothetical protein n=1 Tax=Paenirhodobacter enshiensis TaxID=1105367 RepID=UPI0035B0341C
MTTDPNMTATLSDSEVDTLIRRAGLSPDAELRSALHASWTHAAQVTSAVRKPRPHSAEPAHVFALPVPPEQPL